MEAEAEPDMDRNGIVDVIKKRWRSIVVFVLATLMIVIVINRQPFIFHYKKKFKDSNKFSLVDEEIYVAPKLTLQTEFRLMNFFDHVSPHGKTFNKTWNIYLEKLNLLNVNNVADDEKILNSVPIIGTATSSNHMGELLKLLTLISKVYKPAKMVFIYDLGLSQSERGRLEKEFGQYISEIRTFIFANYPPYFTHLRGFRWKPIIIAELLNDFPSMWWLDSSIRLENSLDYFTQNISRLAGHSKSSTYYPWLCFTTSEHSIYAATDKKMCDFIPFPIDTVGKNLTMWAATIQLIFGTRHVRENVLRYWVLCALEENCMEPVGSTISCNFGKSWYTDYGGCHRQDQSAINLLLARVTDFNETRYHRVESVKGQEGVFKIEKW